MSFTTNVVKHKIMSPPMINDVIELVKKIQKVRDGWPKAKHASKTYAVTHEDTIKMHINMYLGHMARFFFPDISNVTALVLDASDMGTSIVFNLFGINDIIVPNLYKGDTDFVTMRKRMKDVQSFPMSVEDYIRNWEKSNSINYRKRVLQTAAQSKYPESKINEKKYNVEMLSRYEIPYPKQFDVVYLDFCGAFTDKTEECINDLLSKPDDVNTRSKIIAVTGSVMGTGKEGNDTDTQLDNIITFMNDKGYIMDQTFVYLRRVNHSRVAPGVEIGRTILNIGDEVKAAHPDHGIRYFKGVVVKPYPKINEYDIQFSDERVIDRKKIVVTDTRRVHRNQISNRGGTKMFFVSFIGTTADEKIREWNSKFTSCNGTACKLQKDHRYCLFHEKNEVQQSFCNRLLQDFYILTPSKIRRNEDFIRVLGDDVPVKPKEIIEHQKRKQKKNEALYALQYKNKKTKKDWQAYDARDIQSYIVNSRNIKYKGKRDYELNVYGVKLFVRIECTFKNSVAVSLSGNNNEALRTLDKLVISDVFKETEIECLFNKTGTKADHALIFIPKDYFDHLAQDDSSEEESSSSEEDSDSEEEEDEESELPYDLEYVGDVRLNKLSVQALRQECKKREIEISGGVQKKTCIRKLKEWKKAQKGGISGHSEHELVDGDFEHILENPIRNLTESKKTNKNCKVCPECGVIQNSNVVKNCKNCKHEFVFKCKKGSSLQGISTKKCICGKNARSNRDSHCIDEKCGMKFPSGHKTKKKRLKKSKKNKKKIGRKKTTPKISSEAYEVAKSPGVVATDEMHLGEDFLVNKTDEMHLGDEDSLVNRMDDMHLGDEDSEDSEEKEREKKYPRRRTRNNEPDYTDKKGSKIKFNQKLPVTSMPIKGSRIEWLWDNDVWYIGTVIEVTSNSVTVSYDDGTTMKHPRAKCIKNKTWKYVPEQ